MSALGRELPRQSRIGWLRAAVMGANDGVISVACLIIGIAAGGMDHAAIIVAAVAGLVSGAMSMAAGEYVSVSSQLDMQKAQISQEKIELETNEEYEFNELANIYIGRGLDPALAKEVAEKLTAKDALAAHMRDELGISEITIARPLLAAFTSAISFTIGAGLPLLVAVFVSQSLLIYIMTFTSLIFLATLGAIAAFIGGSSVIKGSVRVTILGALAMAITALVGILFRSI